MDAKLDTVTINNVEYVRKDQIHHATTVVDGMKYVVVRCSRAGVFAGYLQSQDSQNVTLKNARRLWYWDGAASLSQLAMEGVSKPENCKFPCAVLSIDLTDAIEIIDATEKAKNSIEGVKEWRK